MKKNNEGVETIKSIHRLQADKRKQTFRELPIVCVARGLWIFAEGIAQLGLALFAIYQAKYGHFPVWGKYGLVIAGALVLVPAAALLSRFFRNVGKA
jgi:hypothetical protein